MVPMKKCNLYRDKFCIVVTIIQLCRSEVALTGWATNWFTLLHVWLLMDNSIKGPQLMYLCESVQGDNILTGQLI